MKLHFAGGDEDEMQLISNYVEDVAIALQDRTDFDVPLRLADNCTKLRVLGTEAVVHGGGGGGGGTTATAPPRGSASTSGESLLSQHGNVAMHALVQFRSRRWGCCCLVLVL